MIADLYSIDPILFKNRNKNRLVGIFPKITIHVENDVLAFLKKVVLIDIKILKFLTVRNLNMYLSVI